MDENRNVNPGEQQSEKPAAEPQQTAQSAQPAQPQQPAKPAQPQQPAKPTQPQQNYSGYGQQTPPPQYAQRPQYGYQPQQYAYVPQQPANRGKGGGWIGFLRVMAWILFAVMELMFIIGGIGLMVAGGYINGTYYYGGGEAVFAGLAVIVVGTLMSFLMIAAINVSLDAAQNIRRTATSTAEMNERLANIERKLK